MRNITLPMKLLKVKQLSLQLNDAVGLLMEHWDRCDILFREYSEIAAKCFEACALDAPEKLRAASKEVQHFWV